MESSPNRPIFIWTSTSWWSRYFWGLILNLNTFISCPSVWYREPTRTGTPKTAWCALNTLFSYFPIFALMYLAFQERKLRHLNSSTPTCSLVLAWWMSSFPCRENSGKLSLSSSVENCEEVVWKTPQKNFIYLWKNPPEEIVTGPMRSKGMHFSPK